MHRLTAQAATDATVILYRNGEFQNTLKNLLSYAMNYNTNETSSYPWLQHIQSTFLLTLKPKQDKVAFACHPQPAFFRKVELSDDDGIIVKGYTIYPDFASLKTFKQSSSPADQDYKKAQCLSWWEVKPLVNTDWFSDIARNQARVALHNHLKQLNTQALYAFSFFDGDVLYAWLITGIYFTVLEYNRERRLPDNTPPPTTPPPADQRPSRRISGKKPEVTEEIDKNAQQFNSHWAEYEPKVHFHAVPIVDKRYRLTPYFLEANKLLGIPREDYDVQPSFFNPTKAIKIAKDVALDIEHGREVVKRVIFGVELQGYENLWAAQSSPEKEKKKTAKEEEEDAEYLPGTSRD